MSATDTAPYGVPSANAANTEHAYTGEPGGLCTICRNGASHPVHVAVETPHAPTEAELADMGRPADEEDAGAAFDEAASIDGIEPEGASHPFAMDVDESPICAYCGKGTENAIHQEPFDLTAEEVADELGLEPGETIATPDSGTTTVDGTEARVEHRQPLLPADTYALAQALRNLDEAKTRYLAAAEVAKIAAGAKKDAQEWVGTCTETVLDAARRETTVELPL